MNLSKNSLLFFSPLIVSILAVPRVYFLRVFIYSPFYLDGQSRGTVDFVSFVPPAAGRVHTALLSLSFITAHLPRLQCQYLHFCVWRLWPLEADSAYLGFCLKCWRRCGSHWGDVIGISVWIPRLLSALGSSAASVAWLDNISCFLGWLSFLVSFHHFLTGVSFTFQRNYLYWNPWWWAWGLGGGSGEVGIGQCFWHM